MHAPSRRSGSTAHPRFTAAQLATIVAGRQVRRVTALIGVGAILLAVVGTGRASAAKPKLPAALPARVISVRDSSELHLVSAVGNTLIEEGGVTGTLPGSVKIRLNIDVEAGTATSRFTLHLRDGSLIGHATGTANAGQGGWESFGGRMWLDRGTGRYAHASGSGNMYGALYRRNDTLRVQTIGRLRY